jgi:hypothetical protein
MMLYDCLRFVYALQRWFKKIAMMIDEL